LRAASPERSTERSAEQSVNVPQPSPVAGSGKHHINEQFRTFFTLFAIIDGIFSVHIRGIGAVLMTWHVPGVDPGSVPAMADFSNIPGPKTLFFDTFLKDERFILLIPAVISCATVRFAFNDADNGTGLAGDIHQSRLKGDTNHV
jgi:hypothetical protein